MNYFRFLSVLLILFISTNVQSQKPIKGHLVIVGGGLEADNRPIYNELIQLAGGVEKARFAVIPSASGVPAQSWASFRNILISYGVKAENIVLIPVALMDDDSTKDVDESTWKNNGNNLNLATLVKSCSAVWFTGGDQLRTVRALRKGGDTLTPVLKAVWDVYRRGGVIGGTSAGAAIMSDAMIGGGNSLAALKHGVIKDFKGDDFEESSGVMMTSGLGFFPHGIVDQHFHQRARIGRLAVALLNYDMEYTLGFGVDENTALIYNSKEKQIKVAGTGAVTILNALEAKMSVIQGNTNIENLMVSLLENGDTYDLSSHKLKPAEGKHDLKGKEYYSNQNPGQAGVLSGNSGNFRDLITKNLIDNKKADRIQNISFSDPDKGFMLTLQETASAIGYYTDKPDGDDHYTVTGIRMDITPVTITVTPVKNE